jgi:hypothetical protein
MDRIGENPGFHADNSITYLQLTPARKHFDEVLKRLALARIDSKRAAHLRHTCFRRSMSCLIADFRSLVRAGAGTAIRSDAAEFAQVCDYNCRDGNVHRNSRIRWRDLYLAIPSQICTASSCESCCLFGRHQGMSTPATRRRLADRLSQERPVAVQGVHNVWCCSASLGKKLARIIREDVARAQSWVRSGL